MSAFTTQKKGKKYSHVVSFKLHDENKKKLDECLWFLKAKGKRQSDTMRDFVDKLHTFLMQSGDRDVETDILKKENRDLNKEVRKLQGLTKYYREETEKLGKFIEANKTEVKTLPNSTQTMPIVKEQELEVKMFPHEKALNDKMRLENGKRSRHGYFTCQLNQKTCSLRKT